MDEKMNALVDCMRNISAHLAELGELYEECERLGVHIIGVMAARSYSKAEIHIENGIMELFTASTGTNIRETQAEMMTNGNMYPGDVTFDLDGVTVLQLKTEDGKITGVKSDV